eukprot:TRINITY_DN12944_c0_g1_i2.p1 TRINITY_DN12944_c0_g1~~TRINITY_DN12944_c0_g1_i2.p1  ORF type:complete len:512 (-),score=47.44 TRINITY_DN12944_c0_g1_i2:104-1579(-)
MCIRDRPQTTRVQSQPGAQHIVAQSVAPPRIIQEPLLRQAGTVISSQPRPLAYSSMPSSSLVPLSTSPTTALSQRDMGPSPIELRQMEDLALAMFEEFHDFTNLLMMGTGRPGVNRGTGTLMPFGPFGMGGGIGMSALMIPDLREDLMNLEKMIAAGPGFGGGMMIGGLSPEDGEFTVFSGSLISAIGIDETGKPIQQNYFSNSVATKGADGNLTRQGYQNTGTGLERIAQERMLNDQGRKYVKERIKGQGEQNVYTYYKNMEEEQAEEFDRKWNDYNTRMKFLDKNGDLLNFRPGALAQGGAPARLENNMTRLPALTNGPTTVPSNPTLLPSNSGLSNLPGTNATPARTVRYAGQPLTTPSGALPTSTYNPSSTSAQSFANPASFVSSAPRTNTTPPTYLSSTPGVNRIYQPSSIPPPTNIGGSYQPYPSVYAPGGTVSYTPSVRYTSNPGPYTRGQIQEQYQFQSMYISDSTLLMYLYCYLLCNLTYQT